MILPLLSCFVIISTAFAKIELDAYSFNNQADGVIPPTDPYPLSTPNINDAVKLALVVGRSGNAGKTYGEASLLATTVTAPTFVWGDSAGNLYFSTPRGHVINKIGANDNIVAAFAGTGVAGYNGEGVATSVQLRKPHGLFGDSNRLVFCDTLNGRLREVSLATNALTNLAGSPLRGYAGDGGLALSSKLFSPFSVWIDVKDNKGDVYFTELHKCTIRKIDGSTQIITTIAGVAGQCGFNGYSGPGVSTHLSRPYALFGDGEAGLLLVADFNNNLVRQYDMASGQISTIAGQGEANKNSLLDRGNGGAAVESVILGPTGVWRDSEGNVYIAESFSSVVRKIDASTGLISTLAGVLGIKGPFRKVGSNALYHPRGIWGRNEFPHIYLYIPDTGNHRIMSYTPAGTRSTVAGNGEYGFGIDNVPAASTPILLPDRTWQDSVGNIYITDGIPRVLKVDVEGVRTTFVSGTSDIFYGLSGDSDNLYVSTWVEILSFPLSSPSSGTVLAGGGSTELTTVGDSAPGTTVNFALDPITGAPDLWTDNNGNTYISTAMRGKVYKVANDVDHTITLVADVDSHIDSITGDHQNYRYVYLATFNKILQMDLNNNYAVTTFMGDGNFGYSLDGSIVSAASKTHAVFGMTTDTLGNLYYTEQARIVRKVSAVNKRLSTVAGDYAGNLVQPFTSTNAFVAAISSPRGLMMDKDNNLIICESAGYRVHKVTFPSY